MCNIKHSVSLRKGGEAYLNTKTYNEWSKRKSEMNYPLIELNYLISVPNGGKPLIQINEYREADWT